MSLKGGKIGLLNELEDVFSTEILFIFQKLNDQNIENSDLVYKIKENSHYLDLMSNYQKYIDRCYDLSILTNKILKLLESGYTQKELNLSTRNPSLDDFFAHLKDSERLSSEFKLFINSIKTNKNKLLDELL